MGTIAKIGNAPWASVAKVNGIAVASMATLCGMAKPSGGGGGPGFDAASYGTLLSWLEADKITGLSNNDLVAQWNDHHSTANHAAQGTSGNQPKYVASAINSLPAVNFGSDADRLLTYANYMTTVRTIVSVERWESKLGDWRVHMGSSYLWWVGAPESSDTLFSSDFGMYMVLQDSGYVNGVATAQNVMKRDTFWNVKIVRTSADCHAGDLATDRGQSGRCFIGDRALVAIYSDRLSDATCGDITTALLAKYNITP